MKPDYKPYDDEEFDEFGKVCVRFNLFFVLRLDLIMHKHNQVNEKA